MEWRPAPYKWTSSSSSFVFLMQEYEGRGGRRHVPHLSAGNVGRGEFDTV
jgi:hypothetical protein